jgi:hypothetical protein
LRYCDPSQAQIRPLRTAEASLAQWEIHIGAMNKLVTGAITLEQASERRDYRNAASAARGQTC